MTQSAPALSVDAPSLALVIPALVERHVGDAAFYWRQHDRSAHSPLVTLGNLAHFDRLLQAHLDGIEVAREVGWALALQALRRWRGPGEAFVCTWLVLKHPPAAAAEWWQAVAGVVASDPERMLRGIISALLWAESRQAAPWVDEMAQPNQAPPWQVAAWRALARAPGRLAQSALDRPRWGQRLTLALASENAHVRAAACRAAAALRNPSALGPLLKDSQAPVAAEAAIGLLPLEPAAEAACLQTLWRAVWQQAQAMDTLTGSHQARAAHRLARWVRHLAMAVPVGHPDVGKLIELLPVRTGLSFVLHHGDLRQLAWVQTQLTNPQCARLAGWVWSAMSGIDLQRQGLAFAPVLYDEATAMPTDDLDPGLPLPNAEQIARQTLPPVDSGVRLAGQALGQELLTHLLAHGPQAQRWIAAQRARQLLPDVSALAVDTKAPFAQQWAQMHHPTRKTP